MLKSLGMMMALMTSSYATEVIVELSQGKTLGPVEGQILERFEVLGKSYLKIETSHKSPIQYYKSLKSVSRVDLNYPTSIAGYSESEIQDVDFSMQWGLSNTGNNEPVSVDRRSPLQGKVGADVNIKKAWELETGHREIIVAVLDTGINLKHPQLAPNLWVNEAEKNGKKGVDDDGNGYVDDIHGMDFVKKGDSDPSDENGHGTHCAGIIGAAHTGGQLTGVMKNVRMMAVRHLNKRGAGDLEGAIKAIGYAVKNNADVLSNSWGSRGHSEIIDGLLAEAEAKGLIVVAAAGNARFNNNDESPTYPANYTGASVISVSSMNAQGRHAAYSSYGKKTVHIAAPGTNVLSSYIKKRRHKSGYRVMSGTSMAAPYVSGIVGLFLSHHGDQYSPSEVRKRIMQTAVKMEELEEFNMAGGRIDAYRFLKGINE